MRGRMFPALLPAIAKATRVMPEDGVEGGTLRQWRTSRGWAVRRMARELIKAADEPVATLSGLMHMINAWERNARPPSDLYLLLYRRIFHGANGSADPAEVLHRAALAPGRAEIVALQLAAFRSGQMDLVAFTDKLMGLQRQVDELAEDLKRRLGEDGR